MSGFTIRYALIFSTVIQQIAGAGSCCCFANAVLGFAPGCSVGHSIETQNENPQNENPQKETHRPACSKCKGSARAAKTGAFKTGAIKTPKPGVHRGGEVCSDGCNCQHGSVQAFVSTERVELKSSSQGLSSEIGSFGFQIPSSSKDVAYRLLTLRGQGYFSGQYAFAPEPMMMRLSWLSVWTV